MVASVSPIRAAWERVSDVAAVQRVVRGASDALARVRSVDIGAGALRLEGASVREAIPPRQFLTTLRAEVERHFAVNHPLLMRLTHVPFSRRDYRTFALQHYSLVGTFTTYLELLLVKAPTSDQKSWIAKVLVDEYGEGSNGEDHAALYRAFLRATGSPEGEEYATRLHRDVTGFVAEHLRICRDEPFLVGLGAVGPGHEWAIPKMFPPIIRGLERAGFSDDEIRYFKLHVIQDEDHGRWLEEALELAATTVEAQSQIRRGALLSLAARARFWAGVQDKIVRYRQPENLNLRSQARDALAVGDNRGVGYAEGGELTLAAWKAKLARAGIAAASHA